MYTTFKIEDINIKTISIIIFTILFTGCTLKHPSKSISSTILIKTPNMKYHDKGFIYYYEDYIKLQLLNIGQVVLNLKIYQDKICKGTFECMSSKEFNEKYFHSSYNNDFLFNLFKQNTIYFKDKKNNILIKVK